jgi:hypothetical protein
VRDLLQNYLKSKGRKAVASEYVFVSTSGNPLKAHWMERSFVRLRARSGIIRRDMRYREPQMRDLRSTFAVHRIAAWIKEGADLNRMLPALSANMGLSGVTAIERYLSLTPERFKKELNKLSPQRGRKRWRERPGADEVSRGSLNDSCVQMPRNRSERQIDNFEHFSVLALRIIQPDTTDIRASRDRVRFGSA